MITTTNATITKSDVEIEFADYLKDNKTCYAVYAEFEGKYRDENDIERAYIFNRWAIAHTLNDARTEVYADVEDYEHVCYESGCPCNTREEAETFIEYERAGLGYLL